MNAPCVPACQVAVVSAGSFAACSSTRVSRTPRSRSTPCGSTTNSTNCRTSICRLRLAPCWRTALRHSDVLTVTGWMGLTRSRTVDCLPRQRFPSREVIHRSRRLRARLRGCSQRAGPVRGQRVVWRGVHRMWCADRRRIRLAHLNASCRPAPRRSAAAGPPGMCCAPSSTPANCWPRTRCNWSDAPSWPSPSPRPSPAPRSKHCWRLPRRRRCMPCMCSTAGA